MSFTSISNSPMYVKDGLATYGGYLISGYQLPNQQSLVYSTVNVRMVITSHKLDEWSRKFASFSQQCSSCAIE